MPTHHPASYINALSRDRYGTDVPTLWSEIERLDRKLKHQRDESIRKDHERQELRRRYEKLQKSYRAVWEGYERVVEELRLERGRWRRMR
ncbi:hypothetical protein LTR91_022965 [Friedmanniomyces endolithicus]|uniref:Uncharacterized protein n=1 Tax=Friedmanniomyces endolithicus TaxID=329885 RepID=A0AAN6H7K2_9PEZI|nr:hypothetical protein LTR94_018824 [Friedmanniomyces endolithicus]KAK0773839.1 hypothetical protein LTR38_016417 [Friedmanniomyces endolithicus]KAK0779011.1 hypothetical protein LTR75_015486 [Friedmanniomyces endolithicus]KAK0792978.1 hypothetical protein LTR59_008350 [Friedmanniomyces endolithicus]KAK0837580.1 hypothetical protein LTR03_012694 [Friedmanniomyces endolithicus]